MKHFWILILCILTINNAPIYGQSKKQDIPWYGKKANNKKNDLSYARARADVQYPTFADTCAETVFSLFLNDTWGTVSGMNGYIDLEKAQMLEFNASASYRVIGLAAYMSQASVVGDGNVKMKVYSYDEGTGGPGELLGESITQKVSALVTSDTSVDFSLFGIPESTNIDLMDSRFFVSVDFEELYATNDTVSIWQTSDGCGNGDNTWEKFGDGTWFAVNNLDFSWGINFDILLAAAVEFDEMTNLDDFIKSGHLKLYPAFPNPAQDAIVIRFGLDTSSDITIEVFDSDGKSVEIMDRGFSSVGLHEALLNIHSYASGSYYYRIKADHGEMISRFVKP